MSLHRCSSGAGRLFAALALSIGVSACPTSLPDPVELEGDDPGECDDGADNDGNGLFDCDDPACEAAPVCEEEEEVLGAPEIRIEPAEPVTADDLTCVITTGVLDPEGGEVEYAFRWTVGGEDAEIEGAEVSAARTSRSERWACIVVAHASGGAEGPEAEVEVQIGNTPPTTPVIEVQPPSPMATQPLSCVIVEEAFDADGDPIDYNFQWTVDGQPWVKTFDLRWQDTVPGQTWTCEVRAWDLTDQGPPTEVSTGISSGSEPHPAAGLHHTCAVAWDGTAVCWGDDSEGQVSGIPPDSYSRVTSGDAFSCAIPASTLTPVCWGASSDGQDAAPEVPIYDIAAGPTHGCATGFDGRVRVWGSAAGWAEQPPDDDSWLQVGAGPGFCCAIFETGSTTCWGPDAPEAPAEAAAVAVSGGDGFACVLDGLEILCWGDDSHGQVSGAPAEGEWSRVAAGTNHGCAVEGFGGGPITCWGDDTYGQATAPPNDTFLDVSAGTYHSCGTHEGGEVECWGCTGEDSGQCTVTPF